MEQSNIKLELDSDISSHPMCKHGPTLLFSRNSGSIENPKKFFACSAYRNRKACDFYQEHGEKINVARRNRLREASKNYIKENDFMDSYKQISKFKTKRNEASSETDAPPSDVNSVLMKFCHDCSRIASTLCDKHDTEDISIDKLKFPSKILKSKSLDKKEAQYFFSSATKKLFVKAITDLEFTHVLCIGCPSIFECLPENIFKNSLLLDIDPRFQNFYDTKRFLWYNFFNGHFFHGENSASIYRDFLVSCDNLLILIDPPFGTKTELISRSLDRTLEQLSLFSISAKASLLWVFPYFMERQICEFRKDLVMSDYRVTYEDHQQFGKAGRKLGSPVRLFTSISLSKLHLPPEEGYKYCVKCKIWVSNENNHCDQCGTCTSKDGRTYVHCSSCSRCVKPTYSHCVKCDRCKLPQHQCQKSEDAKIASHNTIKPVKRKQKGGKKFKNKRFKKH